jgi:hypothetical protein
MPVRTAWAGTVNTGDTVTEGNLDSLPGGWLGYGEITATSSAFTTEATITGLNTGAMTVGPSRRLLILLFCHVQSSVTNDWIVARIKEGATVINDARYNITLSSVSMPVFMGAVVTPSQGSHTYSMTGERLSGTGSTQVFADSTRPAWIMAIDIGPA